MKHMKSWARSTARAVLRAGAARPVARLCQEPHEDARRLGAALQESLQDSLAPAERDWVERIENLRQELNASLAPVEVADLETATSTPDRTAESLPDGAGKPVTVGAVCQQASKPYFWALLLFKLVRKYEPTHCVELGTCLGISAAFAAAALKLNGNAGRLVTMEGSTARASLASNHLRRLGLDNAHVVTGDFTNSLGDVLAATKPVDYAFIDGHHDEQATLAYFEQMLPAMAPNALVVFDDISWSRGMRRAWQTIAADARVRVALDVRQMGVCLLHGRDAGPRQQLRIPLL